MPNNGQDAGPYQALFAAQGNLAGIAYAAETLRQCADRCRNRLRLVVTTATNDVAAMTTKKNRYRDAVTLAIRNNLIMVTGAAPDGNNRIRLALEAAAVPAVGANVAIAVPNHDQDQLATVPGIAAMMAPNASIGAILAHHEAGAITIALAGQAAGYQVKANAYDGVLSAYVSAVGTKMVKVTNANINAALVEAAGKIAAAQNGAYDIAAHAQLTGMGIANYQQNRTPAQVVEMLATHLSGGNHGGWPVTSVLPVVGQPQVATLNTYLAQFFQGYAPIPDAALGAEGMLALIANVIKPSKNLAGNVLINYQEMENISKAGGLTANPTMTTMMARLDGGDLDLGQYFIPEDAAELAALQLGVQGIPNGQNVFNGWTAPQQVKNYTGRVKTSQLITALVALTAHHANTEHFRGFCVAGQEVAFIAKARLALRAPGGLQAVAGGAGGLLTFAPCHAAMSGVANFPALPVPANTQVANFRAIIGSIRAHLQ